MTSPGGAEQSNYQLGIIVTWLMFNAVTIRMMWWMIRWLTIQQLHINVKDGS